jgi:outer membrane receptor for ferrienterochelin and colicin
MRSSTPFRGLRQVVFSALAAFVFAAPLWSLAPAHAQRYDDTADEAENQFQLGNEAYLRGDYRQALAHWFMSNRLAPNQNVVFNIARAYEQAGELVEAYRYYQQFSAGQLSAAERSAVDEALRRVGSSVALVEVITEPPGARVFLNRRDLGSYGATPIVLAVEPGEYTVLLDLGGHEPAEVVAVRAVKGRREVARRALVPIRGTLEILGKPVGAIARVEGGEAAQCELPCSLDVAPGDLSVSVSAPGHEAQSYTVRVEANGAARLEVALAQQTGSLVVQADERDALIVVDGAPVGFAPAVVDRIPVGKHTVVVQQEGFRAWQAQVEVSANERTLVQAELQPAFEVAAASRTTEDVRDAPASVSLISGREIQALGAQTLSQAIAGTRGVYLNSDETYESLGFRGFAPFGQYGNRVLVQVDGHTVNDDWVGSSFVGFDLLPDLSAVERIEVVRGPGSALYGTGAFFGVVNLVTRSQAPRSPVTAGVSLVGDGAFRVTASGGAEWGEDSGAWVSGGGIYGQGRSFYSPAQVGNPAAPDGRVEGVGGFEAGGALLRAWWSDFSVHGYFNERTKQIPTGSFGTLFGDTRTTTRDRRAFFEARWEPRLSSSADLLTRVSYDHVGYRGVYAYSEADGGALRETYHGHWMTAEVRADLALLESLRLQAGTEYQFHFGNDARGTSDVDGEVLDEQHPFHVWSVFAMLEWRVGGWLDVSAGGRFDGWWIASLLGENRDEQRFLWSANPRGAIIFHTSEDGTLKFLGGRAFRAPSVYELTYWDGGLTQVQSTGLDPETILTVEVEYSHRLPAQVLLTASAFLNAIDGLIEQVGSGTQADPLRYVNRSDEVATVGFEVEASTELRRGWRAYLQYSGQQTTSGQVWSGKRVANSPSHLVGAKLTAPLVLPSLLLTNRWVIDVGRLDREGNTVDAAVLWDVVLSGSVASAGLRYSAGVRNLLDWDNRQPVGEDLSDLTVLQPGRTFFADLQLSF